VRNRTCQVSPGGGIPGQVTDKDQGEIRKATERKDNEGYKKKLKNTGKREKKYGKKGNGGRI
jgi:hypothetical protein